MGSTSFSRTPFDVVGNLWWNHKKTGAVRPLRLMTWVPEGVFGPRFGAKRRLMGLIALDFHGFTENFPI